MLFAIIFLTEVTSFGGGKILHLPFRRVRMGGNFAACRSMDLRVCPTSILVRDGKLYFLEVKWPGAYQSPEQKEFQRRAEAAGAYYGVQTLGLRSNGVKNIL